MYKSNPLLCETYLLNGCKSCQNKSGIANAIQTIITNMDLVRKLFQEIIINRNVELFCHLIHKISFPIEVIRSSIKNNNFLEEIVRYNKQDAQFFIQKYQLEKEIDLKTKINLFVQEGEPFPLLVSHENIIEDSIEELNKKSVKCRSIRISYLQENGSDCGGLGRDWFSNVSYALISAQYFIPTPNGSTLIINKTKTDLNVYRFAGQLIGLALFSKKLINLKLTSSLWKQLIHQKVKLDDLKDYDTQIYNSLKWILDNKVDSLETYFVNNEGNELIENGYNILVDETNKASYVSLYVEDLLFTKYKSHIQKMIEGFNSAMDENTASLFTVEEWCLITNGEPKINIEELKTYAVSNGINHVENFNLFIKAISKWDEAKIRKLLRFITGSSQLPIGGFSSYEYFGGKFTICFVQKSDRLPITATCFNKMTIPAYNSEDLFNEKLTIALECVEFANV